MGKSTITCIDKDGDRKGVGPGCEAPDADDTDSAVGTGAEALAKHGTMAAFLRHLGYNPTRIWYVSPTGNDTTGQADNVNLPFKTYYKVSLSLKPGEVVMFRGGTWTERAQTHKRSAMAVQSST